MLGASKALTLKSSDPFSGGLSSLSSAPHPFEVSIGKEEIAALREVDLALPPELAEPSAGALSDLGRGDRMRLGPPPVAPSEADRVNAAVGRMLESYEERRRSPVSQTAEAAVKEAKMIAVLDQIHRLRLDIASKSRRPV